MALDDGADRSNRSSLGRLEPPAVGVTGDEPAHGTNGAPNLRSDVPSRQSMGWPTGREPHGHGVSVVIRAGESPAHGEGRQVARCHGTGGARDAKRRNRPGDHPLAEGHWRAGCSEMVRRENGESNPCRRQGKPGEVLPGQPSYPKVKVSRDKSMAVKRGFGRTCQTQRPARPARYGESYNA